MEAAAVAAKTGKVASEDGTGTISAAAAAAATMVRRGGGERDKGRRSNGEGRQGRKWVSTS